MTPILHTSPTILSGTVVVSTDRLLSTYAAQLPFAGRSTSNLHSSPVGSELLVERCRTMALRYQTSFFPGPAFSELEAVEKRERGGTEFKAE
jgi:hypothetical protein